MKEDKGAMKEDKGAMKEEKGAMKEDKPAEPEANKEETPAPQPTRPGETTRQTASDTPTTPFLEVVTARLRMLLRQPLILVLIAFWMLMSSLSDIIQITYFKKTHGKRIFKMTPIHHHFEMSGFSEYKIVITFSITGIIFGILGIITLLAF